ncbi:MAG TPA: diheme cytochrome c [Ideonella sp.]|nr:diheme cytochrome c [Ideonella sp.]
MNAGVTLAALLAALLPLAASASGGERGARVPLLPAYQNECGACHVAYPPGMLPAASWRRLTSDLPHHFGTDASLDAPTLTQLSGWLDANAGRGKRVDKAPPPEDRITRSLWFERKHDDISAATWKRPSIKSPANCAACHPRAAEGSFDEHAIRIPRQ